MSHRIDGPGNNSDSALVKITFVGANPSTPVGMGYSGEQTSFFIGDDPNRWVVGAKQFSKVVYEDLWNGIDLVYRITESGVKYDYILEPRADAGLISMRVEGHDALSIDNDGNLVYSTCAGDLIDGGLKAFYLGDVTSRIECSFDIRAKDHVGYALGSYDERRTVVIDPLIYSTFVGSDGGEVGWDLEVDDDGNVYVTGNTNTKDFPTTPGAMEPLSYQYQVAFVVKLNASGSRVLYSACIGGTWLNYATSIDVDDEGCAYITGWTWSDDFPKTDGTFGTPHDGRDSMFVTKLAKDGKSLKYSCQISGKRNDHGYAVEVDRAGYAYVAGDTASDNFPTTDNASQTDHYYNIEAFVLKLDRDGSRLIYSTYVTADGAIEALDIALDDKGNAYVTGIAGSDTHFPITEGAFQNRVINMGDCFALKLDANGSKVLCSTFIGGNGTEDATGIEVDKAGNIYVTGHSQSRDFPTTAGAFKEKVSSDSNFEYFVCKFNSNLTRLVYSTFIGPDPRYSLNYGMDIDVFGHVYITGSTSDQRFPTTDNAYKSHLDNEREAFISQVSTAGDELLYSSFLGGGEGYAVVVDDAVNAYVTGTATDREFPTTTGAYCVTMAGGSDAFVLKIDLLNTVDTVLNISEGPVLFSGYKHYDFSIDGNPLELPEEPKSVRLTLDAGSANVVLRWNDVDSEHMFSEELDPHDLVSLDLEGCEVRRDPEDGTINLDFLIMFDWSWPHEGPCDVFVDFIWDDDVNLQSVEEGAFSVENDLDFFGQTQAVGEVQGPLVDGDWIAPGEKITIEAPSLVYDGTTTKHPPAGTVNISVVDGRGQHTTVPNDKQNGSVLQIRAPDGTDVENYYRLGVEDLPGNAEFYGKAGIGLPVDGDMPIFRNHIPGPDEWHSSSNVMVSVTAVDGNTSGANPLTLEYSYSTSGPTTFGEWTRNDLEVSAHNGNAEGQVSLDLQEGDENWVRWRVWDMVGNGPSEFVQTIKVDTQNVSFTDPFPDPEAWLRDNRMEAGVTITDLEGSGIDVSSIQYRVSPRNLSQYGEWMDWDEGVTPDSETVLAQVSLDLGGSGRNYVQWRAFDIAGNGLTTSPHYRIRVDMTNPWFEDFSPAPLDYQASTDVEVAVTVSDDFLGSGVDLSSVQYLYFPNGETPATETWMDAGMQGSIERTRFTILISMTEGPEYMVRLRCQDVARNGPVVSGDHMVRLDLDPPRVDLVSPREDEKQPDGPVTVRFSAQDELSGIDKTSVTCVYSGDGRIGTGVQHSMEDLVADGSEITGTITLEMFPGMNNVIQFTVRDTVGNEAISEVFTIWVNRPPVAAINHPIDGFSMYDIDEVELNATNSTDPDGDSLEFEWQLEDTILGNGMVFKDKLPVGTHNITLVVMDDMGEGDSATITITVEEWVAPRTEEPVPNWGLPVVLFISIMLAIGVGTIISMRRSMASP